MLLLGSFPGYSTGDLPEAIVEGIFSADDPNIYCALFPNPIVGQQLHIIQQNEECLLTKCIYYFIVKIITYLYLCVPLRFHQFVMRNSCTIHRCRP